MKPEGAISTVNGLLRLMVLFVLFVLSVLALVPLAVLLEDIPLVFQRRRR